MTSSEPARTTADRTRIRWLRVAGLAAVAAAIGATSGLWHGATSSSSPAAASPSVTHGRHLTAPGGRRLPPLEAGGAAPRSGRGAALGEADGAVPDGTTVFDDQVPGITRLDPALLGALRHAASEASGSGVEFLVDSGWRSPAYQSRLLQEAIAKYGSEAEALRWVAAPTRSAHVQGDAVDVGHAAAAWLSEHGAAFGLCQIYGNEPWHFELRPVAVTQGCPGVYADPTQDPRMQR